MNDSPVLEMRGICKAFDKSIALDAVNFQLHEREIHGLLGGNGAGKTTLMNILFGLYRMDAGEIFLRGKKVNIQSPRDAIQNGIGMVHQHFLQIRTYTVLENIVLGSRVKNRFTMDLKEETRKIESMAQRFGMEIDLNAIVEDLPMGSRQKIEILKALYRGVDILILDEPTTNLTPQEVDALFNSLRVMVNENLSIVFITHKIKEVLGICDRISVLRNGQNIVSIVRDAANEEAFVRAMVGEDMDIQKSVIFSAGGGKRTFPVPAEQHILSVEEIDVISAEGIARVKNVSLKIHEGEILGIAGVAGNGQRELAESLLAIHPISKGKIVIGDVGISENENRNDPVKEIAYIPEDRLQDGFLPKANVAQNLILGFHKQVQYTKGAFIDWKRVYSSAGRLIDEYHIKTKGPSEVGGNLSGGNIQRVLIARAFSCPSRCLVAHNPTRGLDIPSMDFVYTKMLEYKEKGLGILLLSEDLDELLLLCDRIAVIYHGEILGTLPREKFERYEIGRMMSGIRDSV